MHKWFAATACIPTYTEVLTRDGWKRIDEVQVGEEIACADLDNLKITFEAVYDKVPVKRQDTYTNNELTATKDHRMVYRLQNGKQWKIDEYKNLINKQSYIPLAGYSNFNGIDISDEMIQFLVAVQADGHYMYETLCNKEKGFYGLEFHLKKERKINRIQSILEALDLKYVRGQKNDGSVSIRIYNNYNLKIVDLCELYLTNKCYNWNWINMSPHQADIFIKELLLWDGSISGNKYT